MITYQREWLSVIKEEVEPLLVMHWEEVGMFDKNRVPLWVDWSKYLFLEEWGGYLVVTVRDDDKLVGYLGAFITEHMHYNKTKFGMTDVVYVLPEYRKGLLGVKLISESEQDMKGLGVRISILSFKVDKSMSKIAERLGYSPLDTQHFKEL